MFFNQWNVRDLNCNILEKEYISKREKFCTYFYALLYIIINKKKQIAQDLHTSLPILTKLRWERNENKSK